MKSAAQGFVSLVRWLIRSAAGIKAPSRGRKTYPDQGWAAEVQRGLSFLFTEHGATLVESSYQKDSFGSRTAVIRVGNLILAVSRNGTLPPDYIEARIAPVHAPVGFKPPSTAWEALARATDGTIPPAPPYNEFTLEGVSKLLRENFMQLDEAFSADNYPATKEKMDKVEQEHWRQWSEAQAERSSRPSTTLKL